MLVRRLWGVFHLMTYASGSTPAGCQFGIYLMRGESKCRTRSRGLGKTENENRLCLTESSKACSKRQRTSSRLNYQGTLKTRYFLVYLAHMRVKRLLSKVQGVLYSELKPAEKTAWHQYSFSGPPMPLVGKTGSSPDAGFASHRSSPHQVQSKNFKVH